MQTATDADLLLIQYPDVVSAVQVEEARLVKLAQDKEAAEDKSDGSDTDQPAETPATDDGTPTPASVPTAAPVVQKPTLADIVVFLDSARWDLTLAGPIVAPLRRFVAGELSAQATATALEEARHNRQRKARVTGLPDKVGALIVPVSSSS